MPNDTVTAPQSKLMFWTGWALTILLSALFIFSGVGKFRETPELVDGFNHLGWKLEMAVGLGILELACVVVYLVPQTAVMGAVLSTGYLGGAIATHVRIGEPVIMHVVIGIVIWGALWLRDPRLRALLPLCS